MSFLKALCISFAIYSKIPVPHFDWKEKEMKYQLIFFPWVGAVTGVLMVLWNYVCIRFGVGETARVLIMAAVPLFVTGGFHVDGFMDTMDALKSYKSKEEKLDILKDPHIGAFSVLMLVAAGLVYVSALSSAGQRGIVLVAAGYVLSRCLSGIGVLIFPNARKNGMLNTFNRTADKAKKTVLIFLILQAAAAAVFMVFVSVPAGVVSVAAALLFFIHYRQSSIKNFGGITGDTAGYFVTVCEILIAVCAAVQSFI